MAKRHLARFALGAVCTFGMGSTALALPVPVQVDFSAINNACAYTEDSFEFRCTGGHTDRDLSLYFHDGGSNLGNNDVVVTQTDRLAFRIIRLDWLPVDTPLGVGDLMLIDHNGVVFFEIASQSELACTVSCTKIVDSPLLTSLTLSTTVDAHVDNLVFEVLEVPEPAALSLVGLGLLGLGFARRGSDARTH